MASFRRWLSAEATIRYPIIAGIRQIMRQDKSHYLVNRGGTLSTFCLSCINKASRTQRIRFFAEKMMTDLRACVDEFLSDNDFSRHGARVRRQASATTQSALASFRRFVRQLATSGAVSASLAALVKEMRPAATISHGLAASSVTRLPSNHDARCHGRV